MASMKAGNWNDVIFLNGETIEQAAKARAKILALFEGWLSQRLASPIDLNAVKWPDNEMAYQ